MHRTVIVQLGVSSQNKEGVPTAANVKKMFRSSLLILLVQFPPK